jgi:hypothetical protein
MNHLSRSLFEDQENNVLLYLKGSFPKYIEINQYNSLMYLMPFGFFVDQLRFIGFTKNIKTTITTKF